MQYISSATSSRRLLPLIAFAFAAITSSASAGTLVWAGSTTGAGGGSSNTWNTTTANWLDGATPVLWTSANGQDIATLGGTAGTVTVAGTVNANRVNFQPTTGGYTINGGTLNLTGAAAIDTSSNTVNTQTVLGASLTISGSNGFTRLGNSGVANSQTIQISGGNTFTGAVTLNGGRTRFSDATGANTAAGSGTVTVNNGAQLWFSGGAAANNIILNSSLTADAFGAFRPDTTVSGQITLQAANSRIGSSSAGTLSGKITGSGNVAFNSGTINLTSNANDYTGNTTISGGTVNLADDARLKFVIGSNGVNNQILGTSTLNLNGDFEFDLSGAGTNIGDSWNIVNVGTLTETFGSTFMILGFTENANIWTGSNGGATYEFSELTGALTVVPEPSACLLLALGGMFLFGRGRNRRL